MQDLDLLEAIAIHEARQSFWAYRQYIGGNKFKKGWFQEKVSHELQGFYKDLIDGKRPKLVVSAPPQHGKSRAIVEFISWVAGKHPDLKTIYTSFSENLGIRANRQLQRLYVSDRYKKIFPGTRISDKAGSGYAKSAFLIEYVDEDGSFRNTTVGGAITGETLSLGVIDDPIKGRKDANSITVRNTAWDWFTDDFFTRFDDDAGFLTILTRWHIDDPVGRMKDKFPDIKFLSFAAMAKEDEEHRKVDQPLFPEHKSLEFLLERKRVMDVHSWESLYQQNPMIIGGEIIKPAQFQRYSVVPRLRYRKIYADTAQKTKEYHDYSVFECWGLGYDGGAYLLDLVRNKWEAPDLKRAAVDFWNKHKSQQDKNLGTLRSMNVEDKASGTGLIQDLKREDKIPIKGIPRSIDKLTRVMDILGYIEAGYVFIPENAAWVSDFMDECEKFSGDDGHMHDDQIDPMCDALSDMLSKKPKGFFS